MTIHVRHIDDTNVEITLTPGRLGRLFGAKVRRGLAVRDHNDTWRWKLTRHDVGGRIEREIECTPIEEVPPARAMFPVERRGAP